MHLPERQELKIQGEIMLIKAEYEAKTVFEIDYDTLKNEGIKVIAFDLDSTVMKSKSGEFSNEVLTMFENLKKDFKLLIISNNNNPQYIEKAENQIDFPVIAPAKKPATQVSKEFLKEHSINPKDMVMVGDRPLTDILFGKFLGCKTILVDSISWMEEKPIVRLARKLERIVNI